MANQQHVDEFAVLLAFGRLHGAQIVVKGLLTKPDSVRRLCARAHVSTNMHTGEYAAGKDGIAGKVRDNWKLMRFL